MPEYRLSYVPHQGVFYENWTFIHYTVRSAIRCDYGFWMRRVPAEAGTAEAGTAEAEAGTGGTDRHKVY
jgi:hypothetical protein